MSPPYGSELSLPDVEQRLHEVKADFEKVQAIYSGFIGFFRGLPGLRTGDKQVLDFGVQYLSLTLRAHHTAVKEGKDAAGSKAVLDDQSHREIVALRKSIRDFVDEYTFEDDLDD